MRDTASVLDGLTLDSKAALLAGEVGREPGRLRVGLCLAAFTGADVDEGCVMAAREAGALLERLGHHVEETWPAALYEPDLLALATKLAAAQTAATVDTWSRQLGCAIEPDGSSRSRSRNSRSTCARCNSLCTA